MVAGKKTGGKKAEAKIEVKITAAVPKSLRLTRQQKQALSKALTAAGETFVESLERKGEEIVVVTGEDIEGM